MAVPTEPPAEGLYVAEQETVLLGDEDDRVGLLRDGWRRRASSVTVSCRSPGSSSMKLVSSSRACFSSSRAAASSGAAGRMVTGEE
jgi:hypothetical protein